MPLHASSNSQRRFPANRRVLMTYTRSPLLAGQIAVLA